MVGLIVAGPWLTMVGSRVMARRTSRPSVLIAGRRLSDNPRGAFRADQRTHPRPVRRQRLGRDHHARSSTTKARRRRQPSPARRSSTSSEPSTTSDRSRQRAGTATSVSEPAAHGAGLDPDVEGVTVLHATPRRQQAPPDGTTHDPGVVRAARAHADDRSLRSRRRRRDHHRESRQIAATSKSTLASTRCGPPLRLTRAGLRTLPVRAIVVQTDGSTAAIERARTALEVALPDQGPPATLGEINADDTRSITELQQLTNVVIVVSLVIAGCSLAVSATTGVNDRKRPFSLLRLTGVPVRALRRVVALETAVPLLTRRGAVGGNGIPGRRAVPQVATRANHSDRREPQYYVIVVVGLVACLAIIATHAPAHRAHHRTRGLPQRVTHGTPSLDLPWS